MSKQSKDQQPQSAPASDGEKAPDGQAKPTGQGSKAAASETVDTGKDRAPSPASSADKTGATDPIKPDVAQPVAADDATGKPGTASDATSASSGSTDATDKPAPATGSKSKSAGKSKAGAGRGAGTTTSSATPSATSGAAAQSKPTSNSSSPAGKAASGGGQPPSGRGASSGSGGRGAGGKLGLLALILVILLAIVVAFVGYRGWQKLQAQQAQLSQIGTNSTTLDQLESKVGELDQNRQQNLKMMRGEFDQYRQSLDNTLDKVLKELAQQQQADPREWLHAEAEYLLRLANQRLQLERDVKGAKALLKAADDRLREADNPALVPVRRAIQSELASLDSVPVIDRTGLYLALMAQQEQLARLPLKQDIEEIAAGKGDAKPTGGWRQQLATLGRELKDLVTVRRHDQPLEALITPEQESYLRQNVRLLLEQAQLALLKSEPELYQASLDKATELVEGYYDTDNDGVAKSIDKLKSLRDQDVRPELPDISESSQLLKRFIEQRFGNGGGAQGGSQGSSQGSDSPSGSATNQGSAQGEGA
ncbi:uroporphyrinogen-III C-methyltransferase [Salinicola lusitanus]|uniref:uroporphyrinogen-III C-methyltransferase n=1 Tax=Salinicola lusitanus TaxID=1949085 RepID=UPI000DA11DC6|nr:uroporphyrinogen-III C-methyltransferase [Salinicola lusitanus]